MTKLTSVETSQLAALERRVHMILQAASTSRPPAPEAFVEYLVDALARLKALASESDERPDAVECIERALAAIEAWQRWQEPNKPSA